MLGFDKLASNARGFKMMAVQQTTDKRVVSALPIEPTIPEKTGYPAPPEDNL